MKLNYSKTTLAAAFVSVLIFLTFGCQKQAEKANAPDEKMTAPTEIIKAESPTESYKMLFDAVKIKNTGKIKQLVTKSSMGLAEYQAQMQKKTIDSVLGNGFTETTFAPSLPEIRDERIKDNFGAIEVYSQTTNRWEDLPYMYEDGSWKLAVGDVFQNTYKKPGKGQSEIEGEAANTNNPPKINSSGKFPSVSNSNNSGEMPSGKKPK